MMGHGEPGARPLVRTQDWRATAHNLLNRPNSSKEAFLLQIGTVGLILLSTLFFVLESLPDVQWGGWDVLDGLIAVAFTIELVLRFVVAPDGRGEEEEETTAAAALTPRQARLRLLRQPLILVDICAVVPFWFGLVFAWVAPGASLVLRSLRLVRVLRLLRLSQASKEMQMFVDSVQRCATALRLLLFLLLLQILILGGLVFHLERGPSVVDGMWRDADGITPSTFQSIPEAAWWCLVTVTTVGYGDLVPSTVLGKLVASVAMLTGLLLMAAIISIVGQQGQSALVAAPQLGSCASSGRARRLWLAWHSQGEAQPLGAQPPASGARASRLQSRRFDCL